MLLIYAVAIFAFFVWWIRGSIWPGAFLAFWISIFALTDLPRSLGVGSIVFWFAALAAMTPWYIRYAWQYERKKDEEKLLHGVRFNDQSGD